MLPDGSVVVAAWARDGTVKRDGNEYSQYALRLLHCRPDGCRERASVAHEPSSGYNVAAAVAPTDRGLVVAHISRADTSATRHLRFTFCEDLRCADPRTVTAGTVPGGGANISHLLSVAVAPDGRPVAAYIDNSTGIVSIAVCDTAECRHPRLSQLTEEATTLPEERGLGDLEGVEVAVPPDGRPVLAYRDLDTGAIHLLRCRTPQCASADAVTLTEPGTDRPWPALALDPRGLPMVATHDLERDRIVLITCHDPACTRRATVPVAWPEEAGYLDMAIGPDGLPRILWQDASACMICIGPLRLTTVVENM